MKIHLYITMELLYLIFPLLSTTITSIILSLILPFRFLFRVIFTPRLSNSSSVTLYQGIVFHVRRSPVHHSFNYSIRYALVDLDATTRPPPNHMSADEARHVAKTNGPVFLLTIPPSVGYNMSPVTIYYCYNVEASVTTLTKCIGEVTNTPWGERVTFLFNPNKPDVVAKALHVSPFMDMHGDWSMKTNEPGENLHVVVSVQHPKLGNYFTASLTAKRVESFIESSGIDHSAFFWLMPHKVMFWIYWQAMKLWWKNVAFIPHPKFSYPSYREEAIQRADEEFSCSGRKVAGNCTFVSKEKSASDDDKVSNNNNNRCFTYRDAEWPWC